MIDHNSNGILNRDEFAQALRNYRVSNDDQEIDAVMLIFDQD